MWGDMGSMGWGMLGTVHMAVWWILVILGLVVLAKLLFGAERRSGSGALDILKQRYARGEIDKDKFEQMKRELELTA